MKQCYCFFHVASVESVHVLSISPSWVESDRFVCKPPNVYTSSSITQHTVTALNLVLAKRKSMSACNLNLSENSVFSNARIQGIS